MARIKVIRVCTVDGMGTHIAIGTEFEIDAALAQRLVDGGSFEYVIIAAAAVEE
jgi:hypothetical protein